MDLNQHIYENMEKNILNDETDKCIKQHYNKLLHEHLNIITIKESFRKIIIFLKKILCYGMHCKKYIMSKK